MNIRILYCSILILIFTGHILNAQNNVNFGYIRKGDTLIYGYLLDDRSKERYSVCNFKTNNLADFEKYYPDEIDEYCFADTKLVTFSITKSEDKTSYVFSELILSGKIQLYKSALDRETIYFIKDSSSINFIDQGNFQEVLKSVTTDCAIAYHGAEICRYRQINIKDIVYKYNHCSIIAIDNDSVNDYDKFTLSAGYIFSYGKLKPEDDEKINSICNGAQISFNYLYGKTMKFAMNFGLNASFSNLSGKKNLENGETETYSMKLNTLGIKIAARLISLKIINKYYFEPGLTFHKTSSLIGKYTTYTGKIIEIDPISESSAGLCLTYGFFNINQKIFFEFTIEKNIVIKAESTSFAPLSLSFSVGAMF